MNIEKWHLRINQLTLKKTNHTLYVIWIETDSPVILFIYKALSLGHLLFWKNIYYSRSLDVIIQLRNGYFQWTENVHILYMGKGRKLITDEES